MSKYGKTHINSWLAYLGGTMFLWSQEKLVTTDSSHLEVTYFKDNFKEKYSDEAFNYSINDTGGINLVQRILRTFFNWINDIFGFNIDFIDYKTLEYIVYGILGVIVLYLLLKYLLQNPISSVFKSEAQHVDGFSYVEENIKLIDFDDLINKALFNKNYRLATRYLYLKSLKKLANNGNIEWHFEKTNTDYLNEITDSKLKALFKRVSYIYDYVWYGEFPIDEASFNKNKDDFNHLINTSQHG